MSILFRPCPRHNWPQCTPMHFKGIQGMSISDLFFNDLCYLGAPHTNKVSSQAPRSNIEVKAMTRSKRSKKFIVRNSYLNTKSNCSFRSPLIMCGKQTYLNEGQCGAVAFHLETEEQQSLWWRLVEIMTYNQCMLHACYHLVLAVLKIF